ncbi:Somatostatin receptor type 5 [Mactra antiquata]
MGSTTVEVCTLVWPHGTVGLIMPCISLVVLFVIPVTLISVNYYKILRKYLSAKTAVMQATSQMRNVNVSNSRRKRDLKILKTLVTLVVLFVVMWTPIFMVLGFIIIDKNTDRREISSASLFWTLTLTYANSGVNPFIYGFTSNTLKQYAMCCCRRNKVSVTEMTFVTNTAIHHRTQHIAVTHLSS